MDFSLSGIDVIDGAMALGDVQKRRSSATSGFSVPFSSRYVVWVRRLPKISELKICKVSRGRLIGQQLERPSPAKTRRRRILRHTHQTSSDAWRLSLGHGPSPLSQRTQRKAEALPLEGQSCPRPRRYPTWEASVRVGPRRRAAGLGTAIAAVRVLSAIAVSVRAMLPTSVSTLIENLCPPTLVDTYVDTFRLGFHRLYVGIIGWLTI